MKTTNFLLPAALALASFAASHAQADTLYNNDFGGVVSGDAFNETARTINFGISVTDSFSLETDSNVTAFTVALWLSPGDSLSSLNWSLTTASFGGTLVASGTGAVPTETLIVNNGSGYAVNSEAFNLGAGVALTAGTYWLQLDTASTSASKPAYWDQSDGPSAAFQTSTGSLANALPCKGLCTGSQSFELFSSVPEPGTVALLGAGLATLVGLRKRLQSKNPA